MGPGCFVVALEMASGQVATTLGKRLFLLHSSCVESKIC